MTGGTLGPYQVHEQLGAGAMGEVYRATDPRLGRDVALKVLPESMAGDPQLVVRLEREARALAALNHPNIAAIHGIEESGGRLALVLELVEGETLERRLRRGAMPLDEGLAVAAQIAAALEAAHDRGIVHRDLKPANVKLRPDGTVKVLDFGIARFVAQDDALGLGDGTAVTRTGTIIGTPAYMSPEQLRGQAADARSDLWAFGCVLYEILTGTHTFAADTMSDTIARVIDTEPDWERVPPSTPRSVQRLLRRCLSKDHATRLRHPGDALLEITEARSEKTDVTNARGAPGRWAMAAGGVVVMALVWVLTAWLGGPPERGSTLPAAGLELGLSTQVPLDTESIESRLTRLFAISPDASRLVYVGQDGPTTLLYERPLDGATPRPLQGTAGARAPFFSPDGGSIGFIVGARLWTLRLDGGNPREVGPADSRNGAVWLPSGDIVASRGSVVTRYRGDGQASPLAGDGAAFAAMKAPVLLPDGEHVLAASQAPGSTNLDDPAELRVVSLSDGTSRILVERGSSPQFLPTPDGAADGYLLYASEGSIWAAPVRLPAVELLAPASPVVSDVMMRFNGDAAQYAVADDGTLVYLTGDPADELVWVTGADLVTAASRHLRPFAMPRLSPDGRSVALEVHEGAHALWVLDLDRDALTRVSYAARAHNFAWSPDSRSLLFTRSDDDKQVIAWKRIGDPGDGELVLKLEGHDLWVDSWSADGRWAGISDLGQGDAWLLPMTPGEPPQPAGELIPVGTPEYRERDVMVIPHGQCVAYTSNETGRAEIYLRCFDTGERIQVSSDGGQEPMWADGGDGLYFRSGDRLMRAEVSFAGGLRVRPPVEVHHGDYLQFDPANYDVDDAGGRVLRIRSATEPGSNRRVSIRFGFQRELERLVPLAGAGS